MVPAGLLDVRTQKVTLRAPQASMRSLLLSAFLVGAHAAEKACNGMEVDKPTGTDNPVNEPCYVHDGMCEGYAVCCVKYGTCTATISSNELYYEGGCWSAQSSKGSLREGCTRQGECMAPFLEEVMGGAAAPGKANTLSADKLASMKDVSCAGTDPSAGRLGITIGAIAAVLVVIVLLVVGLTWYCCKKKRGASTAPKGKAATGAA